MKLITLLSAVTVLTSCSSAYRSGQTPDDLYASKPKEEKLYVRTEISREEDPIAIDAEDRIAMMAARNARWRELEYDYYYDYDRYRYQMRMYPYSYSYNPYYLNWTNGYYYNPSMTHTPWFSYPVAIAPVRNNTVRKANLGGYTRPAPVPGYSKGSQTRTYTQPRSYNEDNNSGTRTRSSNSDTRTYSPEPGKSGNNAPAGAPVARPGRGG